MHWTIFVCSYSGSSGASMHAHTQSGQVPPVLLSHLPAQFIWFLTIFKRHQSALAKPFHGVAGGREPSTVLLELSQQVQIKLTPQSFRSNAPVMPIHGHHPAESNCVGNDLRNSFACLSEGQRKMTGKKHSRVHNMQRQLQQMADSQRLVHLARSRLITDRFVIPGRGIVISPGLIEDGRGMFIKIKPVHSYSDRALPRYSADVFQLLNSL